MKRQLQGMALILFGILLGIAEGWPVEKAMEQGARKAAKTLSHFGAW